jgi:hypothetical protein
MVKGGDPSHRLWGDPRGPSVTINSTKTTMQRSLNNGFEERVQPKTRYAIKIMSNNPKLSPSECRPLNPGAPAFEWDSTTSSTFSTCGMFSWFDILGLEN